MSDQTTRPPVVTVVSGSPTHEELAAIITVLAGMSGAERGNVEPRSDRPRVGGWKSYMRTLRRDAFPGPGAWRHSDR